MPEEVIEMLREEPERKILEAVLLHLVQMDRVSVAWAGSKLGLDRWETVRWYTSHGYPYPDVTPDEFDEQMRVIERRRSRSESP